jgi:hypothetical protein
MYYLIKKYQKKLMAVFAVLLMISFVATIGVGRFGSGGGGRGDVVVGHLGKTPVYNVELQNAKDEWSWLSRERLPAFMFSHALIGDYDQVLRAIMSGSPHDFAMQFHAYQVAQSASQLAREITTTIDNHPELFFLLQNEAADNGLQASPDTAFSFLKNDMGMPVGNDEQDQFHAKAIQDLLTVTAQVRHLMDAAKVSQPVWQHEASKDQSVRLSLIDFRASDFEKSVPAPTTQQAQEQFDRFKNVAPNSRGPNNPLGFGYQIAARAKLQYLTIPHQQLVDAVIHHVHPTGSAEAGSAASGDAAYDWEVQAAIYYDAHKDEFKAPATKPAAPLGPALPTTGPAATQAASTQAASTQNAGTQPATTEASAETKPAETQPMVVKPFAAVKQQIIEKLAADDAGKLSKQILDELTARLTSDFNTVRQADPSATVPSTQPATAPAVASSVTTRPAADLMMLAHLEQIRTEIEHKHHVSIQLHEIVNEWQTKADLGKLPGIGAATAADGAPFPEYALEFAHPGMTVGEPPLAVWQPSAPLTDAQQNSYLFRLTAAEPPHAPAGMAPIAKQVTDDWKLGQAYDQAMQAAQKALASAKTSGLSQAGRTDGQNVVYTPLFSPQQAQDLPGIPGLPPAALREALAAASDLITEASPSNKQPDKLVALPAAQRAIVMELDGVQLTSPAWLAQLRATSEQHLADIQRLAADWFDYDHVVSRTGYKAEEKS